MLRLLAEYLLKGIYLGLLLFVALQEPDWTATAKVFACILGGLVLALGIAGWRKLGEGYQVKGRLPAFVLFLLLESPGLVYAGIILGTLAGAYLSAPAEGSNWPLAYAVSGGAGLGLIFAALRTVRQRGWRLGLSLLLAAVLVALALFALGEFPGLTPLIPLHHPTFFGVQLLLGIPIFYLLTFAGEAEESEVEIGAMCAALGLGLGILLRDLPAYRSTGFIIALMLYFWYTTRVLPGLRVFKHSARGFSYAKVGRFRQALLSFRRALQLNPQNNLAREGLWSVHRSMDLRQIADDPETLALVDLDMCLERVTALLMLPGPSPERLLEAHHLLDLVLSQRPALRPVIDYWRAVAFTHARLYDRAADDLQRVLDGTNFPPDEPHRQSVLLNAWQLALTLHPELNRRAGSPQLALPGRRLEAIAAVERHLTDSPDDAAIWELKRILYSSLTEADYLARVQSGQGTGAAPAAGAVEHFDHGYVQQLGQTLINDPARWQRGAEYLRMAVRGLPLQGPSLFQQLAQAYQRAGQADEAWRYYELARQAGRAVGPKNLPEEERQLYFDIVKLLAEDARSRQDLDAAIENYQLYTEYPRSGLETLRILTDLHERKGDVLAALRVNEQALLYNPKDKDLLERKDRYYYSVMPGDLQARLETARNGFDVDYCLRRARTLLDLKDCDLDQLDWAQHLAELARVVRPENLAARLLCARALRRRGEIEASQVLLEEIYTNKPEKFATNEDEEAWFLTCRILGEMYLYDLGKPDLAVPCFQAFRKSAKSGADTLYKLGQAYEQLGDRARAKKCYEHVTSYDSHPLAPDAREALYRLQSN